MSNKKKTSGGFSSLMSVLAIVIALVAGVIIYKFIFGDPANFVEGDPTGEPLEGNVLGVIYKGGVIVPFLLAVNIIIIICSIVKSWEFYFFGSYPVINLVFVLIDFTCGIPFYFKT